MNLMGKEVLKCFFSKKLFGGLPIILKPMHNCTLLTSTHVYVHMHLLLGNAVQISESLIGGRQWLFVT